MSTEAQKLGLDLEEIIAILRANIAPMHATDIRLAMSGERTVDGIVTWNSIGMASASKGQEKTVSDCMEAEPLVVRYNAPLFDTVRSITHSYPSCFHTGFNKLFSSLKNSS